MLALDVVLKETLVRWWAMHINEMKDWTQCSRLMQICFRPEEEESTQKYIGESDSTGHLGNCRTLWRTVSEIKWTHRFIHMLDTIPKNWYLELEMCRETTEWEGLV